MGREKVSKKSLYSIMFDKFYATRPLGGEYRAGVEIEVADMV